MGVIMLFQRLCLVSLLFTIFGSLFFEMDAMQRRHGHGPVRSAALSDSSDDDSGDERESHSRHARPPAPRAERGPMRCVCDRDEDGNWCCRFSGKCFRMTAEALFAFLSFISLRGLATIPPDQYLVSPGLLTLTFVGCTAAFIIELFCCCPCFNVDVERGRVSCHLGGMAEDEAPAPRGESSSGERRGFNRVASSALGSSGELRHRKKG
jgi:hypothetical protein